MPMPIHDLHRHLQPSFAAGHPTFTLGEQLMKGFVQYTLSFLMTFLPPRYRAEGARLRSQALAASLFQCAAAMAYLIYRFMIFSWQRAGIIGPVVDTPSNLPEINARSDAGAGIFMMAEFVFQPLNAFLLYLFYEGLVRYMAARISNQIIGTLPLYAISGIHNLIDRAKYRRYVGPAVEDQVIRGSGKQGYDLKVYSCRAKLHWNSYMAIKYEGEFYQKFKEEYGAAPRRFIYYLRKSAPGHTAVVVDDYKVDNVLKPEPGKFDGRPGLLDSMFPKRKLPPLVADEVVRGGGPRQDYDLKIYSCRPKRDWNTYVTIEFEAQWYQLRKEEQGAKPRPFIYYLRKCPPARPAVVIRSYKPDDVLRESMPE